MNQYHTHNTLWAPQVFLRGRRSTWSTFIEVCRRPATSDAFGSFCVAGQHLEHLVGAASFCVAGRGRCSTWSTSGSFGRAGAALGAPQARFCMTGAALEASQLRIAGHFFKIFKAQTTHTTPSTLHHQTYHHQDNTISTTSSTQSHQQNLISTSPTRQHHLHNTIYTTSSTHTIYTTWSNTTSSTQTIYTTSSTQPHQHITIYIAPSTVHNTICTTPSTQHHLHYIIKHWQVQHLLHCNIIPADTPFVILRCGFFCSVSLTYSTVGCPKTLLTRGVIRSYNFVGDIVVSRQILCTLGVVISWNSLCELGVLAVMSICGKNDCPRVSWVLWFSRFQTSCGGWCHDFVVMKWVGVVIL